MVNNESTSVKYAKALLKEHQDILQEKINGFFEERIRYTKTNFSEDTAYAVKVFAEITSRGAKRLRSALCYYTYKMYDGTIDSEVIKMGIVLELVHAYLLLLDDFMDLSETRRHGPTAHLIFSELKKANKLSDLEKTHLGQSIAVTTGAMGFHLAMQLLNSLKVDTDILVKLSDNLNSKIEHTAYGQIQDIYNAAYTKVSEQDVLKMLEWKTGIYTYENPMHSGAIMAGVKDKEEFQKLTEFALPAGIAFQIQDDILGIFGNPQDTGKSVTDDLKEGKYTLLVHHVLEKGSKGQKEIVINNLGKKIISEKSHNDVKQAMIDSGSYQYSKDMAQKLVHQAKNVMLRNTKPEYNKDGFNFLLGIADYMIERKL